MATELVIGFPPGYLTKELLDGQKCLFATWLAGFVALPINLPGFGETLHHQPHARQIFSIAQTPWPELLCHMLPLC